MTIVNAHAIAAAFYFTSKDRTRPSITGVYLDCGKQRVCATDGQIMCIIADAFIDDDGQSELVTVSAALRDLASLRSASSVCFDKGMGTVCNEDGGPLGAMPYKTIDESPPNYDRVVRPALTGDMVGRNFALNPKLIEPFAKANSVLVGKRNPAINFNFDGSESAALVAMLEYPAFTGMIMPLRQQGNDK